MRSLAGVLLLVACGSTGPQVTDVQPTLHFADLTDAQIARLAGAALGYDATAAGERIGLLAPPCPYESPDGMSFDAGSGCTDPNGVTYAGTVDFDASGFHADELAITTGSDQMVIDGDGSTTYAILGTTADVLVTTQGLTVRSDIVFACPGTSDCNTSPSCVAVCSAGSSGVELAGAGGALVSGTWQYTIAGQPVLDQADVTLQGADTLDVGAGTWTLEGTGRTGTFSR